MWHIRGSGEVHAGFLEEKHQEKRPLEKPRCRWDEKF